MISESIHSLLFVSIILFTYYKIIIEILTSLLKR